MPATFFVLEAGNDCNLAKAFWEQNSEVRTAVAAQACCVCAAGWNGMCGVEPLGDGGEARNGEQDMGIAMVIGWQD